LEVGILKAKGTKAAGGYKRRGKERASLLGGKKEGGGNVRGVPGKRDGGRSQL